MRMKEGLHLLNHFLPEHACVIVCSTATCAFRYATGGTRVSARGAFRVCPETRGASMRGRAAAGGRLSLDGRQRSPQESSCCGPHDRRPRVAPRAAVGGVLGLEWWTGLHRASLFETRAFGLRSARVRPDACHESPRSWYVDVPTESFHVGHRSSYLASGRLASHLWGVRIRIRLLSAITIAPARNS